ncbi:MAG: PilZ domain-containing protein [Candidatus Aminicenantes bacterium]|jgi:c-di-GMP-binding flagellar brake protein YcgR|nr:PilZ domain-containing protein [Candidatus Aminicenantes bacterium]MDH5744975.1 PilZ domain-containing protein [Candidatus Aminicenantes bacterium]
MKGDFNKNTGKEIKRKHRREEIIIDVIYKVLSPLKDVGLTRDISQGGLCLLLNNELPPGTILELKYRLPHEEARQIVTSVEVIWQKKIDKGFLTGVKFST